MNLKKLEKQAEEQLKAAQMQVYKIIQTKYEKKDKEGFKIFNHLSK